MPWLTARWLSTSTAQHIHKGARDARRVADGASHPHLDGAGGSESRRESGERTRMLGGDQGQSTVTFQRDAVERQGRGVGAEQARCCSGNPTAL